MLAAWNQQTRYASHFNPSAKPQNTYTKPSGIAAFGNRMRTASELKQLTYGSSPTRSRTRRGDTLSSFLAAWLSPVLRLVSSMSNRHGVLLALLTTACASAFVQPGGCPGALTGGRLWAGGGAGGLACARPVCAGALRMSEHTEDRCVREASARVLVCA